MAEVIQSEYQFPGAGMEMARIRFEVELSDAKNINWKETQSGLLSFFALYSHEVYLKLAESLKKKCEGN